VNLEYKGL